MIHWLSIDSLKHEHPMFDFFNYGDVEPSFLSFHYELERINYTYLATLVNLAILVQHWLNAVPYPARDTISAGQVCLEYRSVSLKLKFHSIHR